MTRRVPSGRSGAMTANALTRVPGVTSRRLRVLRVLGPTTRMTAAAAGRHLRRSRKAHPACTILPTLRMPTATTPETKLAVIRPGGPAGWTSPAAGAIPRRAATISEPTPAQPISSRIAGTTRRPLQATRPAHPNQPRRGDQPRLGGRAARVPCRRITPSRRTKVRGAVPEILISAIVGLRRTLASIRPCSSLRSPDRGSSRIPPSGDGGYG